MKKYMQYFLAFFISVYFNQIIQRNLDFNIVIYVIIFFIAFIITAIAINLLISRIENIFKKEYLKLWIGAMLLGITTIYAIPSIATFPYQEVPISIEANEQVSVNSKGNEVWILEIKYDNKNMDLEKITRPNGWQYKENALIATVTNNPIYIEVPKAKKINIKFMKHAWSGNVTIKDGNGIKQMNLYDSNYNEYIYTVKSNKVVQSNIKTIMEFMSTFICVTTLIALFLIASKKNIYKVVISIWAGVFAFICTPYIYLKVAIATFALVLILTYILFGEILIKFLTDDIRKQKLKNYYIAVIGATMSTLVTVPDLTSNFMGILQQANITDIPSQFISIIMFCITIGVQIIIWLIICYIIKQNIDVENIKIRKFEKKFLIVFTIIFISINIIVNIKTTAFIYPLHETTEGNFAWGFILGTDSIPNIYNQLGNSFVSNNASDNELRHLLLGSICAPFSFMAYILAFILRIIFSLLNLNINFHYIFGYCFSLVQIGCFMLSALLIYRLLKKSIIPIYAKLFIILYLISFPTLYYALTIEAYAVGLVTLLIFITLCINERQNNIKQLGYICTTGTLLSSAVTLPFILVGKKTNIKKVVIEFVKYGFLMFYTVLLFGQFYELTNIVESLKLIFSFTATGKGSNIIDNLCKFLTSLSNFVLVPNYVFDTSTYQILYKQPSKILIVIGIIILVGAFVGFWLNRKDKVAQICIYWVTFTIFLEVIMGWGAKLNEMSLYAAYFSWAFMILLAMAISKLIKNTKIGIIIISLVIAIVLVYNIDKWIELIRLCIQKFTIFWPAM